MGLAASQARFLNLTARKNNLEYEGQQINQQRTTLANESANYYNQMLTMSVPVPPSTASFQTISYTIATNSIGGKQGTFTIDQVTGSEEDATIAYTRKYVDNYVMNKITEAIEQPLVKNNGDDTWSAQNSDRQDVQLTNITDSNVLKNMRTATGNDELTFENVYQANIGTIEAPVYRYFLDSELTENTDYTSQVSYFAGSATKYEQDSLQHATIQRDANNRISGITYDKTNYVVESATIQDTAAYEDAYNEYTYQTYLYQQQMEEINAQTSVIQAQDKKLELRLKQLDTEQSAISTELESLDSLISKNVEDSFKVFA